MYSMSISIFSVEVLDFLLDRVLNSFIFVGSAKDIVES